MQGEVLSGRARTVFEQIYIFQSSSLPIVFIRVGNLRRRFKKKIVKQLILILKYDAFRIPPLRAKHPLMTVNRN